MTDCKEKQQLNALYGLTVREIEEGEKCGISAVELAENQVEFFKKLYNNTDTVKEVKYD